MANIPVEKSSAGFLPWLLGLLALAAVAFFVYQLIDEPGVVADPAGVEDAAGTGMADEPAMDAPDGAIDIGIDTVRTVAALDEALAAVRDGAPGVADLDGITVLLDDVVVQRLVGDSTFAIGTGDDQTLVVLSTLGESEVGPGDGSDGVYDVNDGATVSIDGSLRRYARGMSGTSDLSEDDMVAAETRQYVIAVRDPSQFSIER